MNKAVFFAAIRPYLGGRITEMQVNVVEAIFDLATDLSAEHVAYVLATGWGESKLTPVRENMNYSAARIRKVWPKRPEAVQFARKPEALANSVYGGRLGNKVGTNDGWLYRGGGIDQLTGRDNYRKIGIEARPEAILEPGFAARSLVCGMKTGRYTGLSLEDFGDGPSFDAVGARAIVNGDGKLNGQAYAAHYRAFLSALRAAGWGVEPPVRPDVPPPAPTVPLAPPAQGWLAWLIALFTRRGP